jgi:hypothetical protein
MTCFGSQRRPAPPDGLGADYMDKKGLHRFTPLIGLVLFVVALWVLHHELRQYHIGQILALTRQIPRERIPYRWG